MDVNIIWKLTKRLPVKSSYIINVMIARYTYTYTYTHTHKHLLKFIVPQADVIILSINAQIHVFFISKTRRGARIIQI